MDAAQLGPIMSADECARAIELTPWNGVAIYMLWNRASKTPIYCGKAESKGRLKSHLKKDDPRSIPSAHNLKNMELTRYWQSQPRGWLGVSFRLFPNVAEAVAVEQGIIGGYGIRKNGGILYNQRMSG